MKTEITELHPADASQLAALACDIYRENYLHLWKPGGADWYMHHHAYRISLLDNEIQAANNAVYFLLEDQLPVGYLKLVWPNQQAGSTSVLEIERIYLRDEVKGKGYGRLLMEFAEKKAAETGIGTLRLKAMDSSMSAIRFYRHLGYRQCGSFYLLFPLMKPAFRGMVIMEKNTGKKNPSASGGSPGF